MSRHAPFTSKDCDVWVGYELSLKIEKIPGGRFQKSQSPSDGQLGIFQTTDSPPKIIDLLSGVFGLTGREVAHAWERSFVLSGIRVIDPLYLFKGKCHNFAGLPQEGRNDGGHLALLFDILSAHIEVMLKRCSGGMITERQVLQEIKLLRSFQGDKWVRKALAQLDRKLDEALPLDLLKSCGLSKIERYAAETWS
jgi:hypothetical protein